MGFGHRVYKQGDSRVPTMRAALEDLAAWKGDTKWLEISDILQDIMINEKGIHPNLDFPAGPAYYLMGFEIDMYTPIFVMSRITGWAAHVLEQNASNSLIRPLSAYGGVKPAQGEADLEAQGVTVRTVGGSCSRCGGEEGRSVTPRSVRAVPPVPGAIR